MILRVAVSGALWLGLAGPSTALEIDLPGEVERRSVDYTCADGAERSAEYIGTGENHLVLLEAGGERRLFVAILSASGVRYASGPFIWWTKGEEATLYDETRPDDDGVSCRGKGNAR